MFVVRNYVTMGGTVACALAIGYLMQNDSALRPAPDAGSERVAVAPTKSSALAGLEGIVLTSSPPADAKSALPSKPSVSSRAQPQPFAKCDLSAKATSIPGANVRLHVKAPCHAEAEVEIHHSGLVFSTQTNAMGSLRLTVPAISEYAIFLISIDDQAGTVATTHVPDMDDYDRVALLWQGDTELQLHALEFGASYGQEGHVWSSPDASGTGLVTHLGDGASVSARNVQVYSYPSQKAESSGAIALTVEAEVTAENCGQALNAQALELRADRQLRSRDLTLNLPDCTEVGDFMVLNNLFEDLTIAAK